LWAVSALPSAFGPERPTGPREEDGGQRSRNRRSRPAADGGFVDGCTQTVHLNRQARQGREENPHTQINSGERDVGDSGTFCPRRWTQVVET